MTKQQAPAPEPKKVARKLPSRGVYIDFKPRNNKSRVSSPKKAQAPRNVSQGQNTPNSVGARSQNVLKPAAKSRNAVKNTSNSTAGRVVKDPQIVRVSRTTVISTTKKKAPRRDFIPPAKEEDFDEEDLLSELDFEEESNTPAFTELELAEIDAPAEDEDSSNEKPEETPEDFMSEKPVEEYASALTALKVTSVEESPFIASVNVDKRPLSEGRRLVEEDDSLAPTDIREESFHGPTRNVYISRRAPEKTDTFDPLKGSRAARRHIAAPDERGLNDLNFDLEPKLTSIKSRELREKEEKVGGRGGTRVVSPKDGHSGPFALIIAITLMVIFGGAVGAVVYLAFFQ